MKTRTTFFTVALSLMIFLTLQIPSPVNAQGVELGDGVVITAEVVAIDRVDRVVTLLGPEGNVVDIEVGHAARNFDQVEIGDQLKVEYYESVALYIGKKGEKPDAAAGMITARSAKGEKPAGVAVEAVDVSATIAAIDKKKRVVTLEMPDGRKVNTKVDKSVKAFETLQKGDSVHARYTEAIAISVEKP